MTIRELVYAGIVLLSVPALFLIGVVIMLVIQYFRGR